MAKKARTKLAETPDLKGRVSYFTGEKPTLEFVPSGCTLLDCALGGGWCIGRVANVVGDRSTAKTGLAMEALINFLLKYPSARAAYRETEAAFDKGYAEAMGLPLDLVDFGADHALETVEDFARDFDEFLNERLKAQSPGLYILDSLDALSDEAEMDRDLSKGSYGMEKAKMLSAFFRKSASKIEKAKVLLMVISQVRDNIGVTFGDRQRRSGGKALDFYASQILWLSHVETLKKTINKIIRPVGIGIRSKVKKNKVGLSFREAEFPYMFAYGIDDDKASMDWLKSVGRDCPDDLNELPATVRKTWAEVETTFLPQKRKYG